MKTNWILKIVCFVFCVSVFQIRFVFATDVIAKQKIETLKKTKEFDYYKRYEPIKKKVQKNKSNSNFNPPNWNMPNVGFLSFIGNNISVLFIGLFVLVVLFILYGLLSESNVSRTFFKTKRKDSVETIPDAIDEEEIDENDFDYLINEAKKSSNNRLVLRLMFLKTLQLLNAHNKIKYQKNKTNYEYSFEITEDSLRAHFMQTADVFAWIWYGKESVDEESYQKLEPLFQQLIKKFV